MNVSIAVCTFNGEKYIRQQLESIANQSFPPSEIIICDDGSTDNTFNIIEDVKTANSNISWRVEKNDVRLGSVNNFQKALQLCKGDVIFLADQDDIWRTKKIERVIEELKKDDQLLGCFSNGGLIDENGSKIPGSLWESLGVKEGEEILFNRENLQDALIKIGNFITGATIALKKSAVQLVTPFNYNGYGEHDFLIALPLSKNAKFIPINELLIDYRLHVSQQVGLPMKNLFNAKKNFLRRDYAKISVDDLFNLASAYRGNTNFLKLKKQDNNYRLSERVLLSAKKRFLKKYNFYNKKKTLFYWWKNNWHFTTFKELLSL